MSRHDFGISSRIMQRTWYL